MKSIVVATIIIIDILLIDELLKSRGRPSSESMMHIAYFPYFHIFKIPLPYFRKKLLIFDLFSFKLRFFFLIYVFSFPPYFCHDAFMHAIYTYSTGRLSSRKRMSC